MTTPVVAGAAAARADAPRWQIWTGRVLTALASFALLSSAAMKLSQAPDMVKSWEALGYPAHTLLWIGVLELSCVVLYLVPRTAVLGAILLTGYLGGAVATHVRVQEPFLVPLLVGVFVWAGLYLREHRLWALAPLRKRA